MLCSRVQNSLSAYLDSELPGEEMLRIRDHLHRCEGCRAEHEAVSQTRRLMRALGGAEPRHPFHLDAALAERAARPSWWRTWSLRASVALESSPLGVLVVPEDRGRWWDGLRRQARLATLCSALGVLVLAAVVVRQPQSPDAVMALVPENVSLEQSSVWQPVEFPGASGMLNSSAHYVSYSSDPFFDRRPRAIHAIQLTPAGHSSYREERVFPIPPARAPQGPPVIEFP
jgi:hypothetical protein